ncbi:MAG: Fic family protein, partial [Candidatus Binatia bacterium]
MEADISAVTDGGESVALMEPMVIAEGSRHRGNLSDFAVEVAARSAGFRRSLPDGVRTALADLVRAMNCYYSNLIEGHDTHPIDIERALNNDYSNDPRKR